MNIRVRILLWFLIPSVSIATIVGVFYYVYTRKTLEQNVFNQLETAAGSLHENVQIFLESKRGRTIDFSADGFVRVVTEKMTMRERMIEHYTSALSHHLITNKKSLDPNIHEILIIDFKDRVIASTDESRIGEVVSIEKYFSEGIFADVSVGEPYYDARLQETIIDFSSVLLTKIGREPIGVIVNRIKIEQRADRIRDGEPARLRSGGQDTDNDYPKLIAVNKSRIIDFSSDGFIRDSTEEIVRIDEKAFYHADLLNTHLLVNLQPLDPDVLSMFVVDLDGKVISSTEIGQIGRDVSDETFFTKTMERGSCISDLYHSCPTTSFGRVPDSRQKTFFNVARLLKDKTNDITIGIIVNRYSGDYFEMAAQSDISELWKTGEVYIVNGDKLMITGSRFIDDAVFKQVVDTEGVRAAFGNGRGTIGIYPDYRGVSVLGASRYLEELGWVILAEKDVSEAFAPLVYLRNSTFIMGIVGILVLFAAAIFISKGITRPIGKLAVNAQNIAKGNLNEEIRVKSKDEIGSLASSFDTMRIELGKSFKNIEMARQNWESTFNSVSELIAMYDMDCRLIRCNKVFLRKLNARIEDIVGKDCYEIFRLVGNKDIPECAVLETVKTSKSAIQEREIPCLDGIYSISCYPHIGKNGEHIGTIQVMRDITERKQTEEKIRKLSHAIEQSSTSVVITDTKGDIEYINPKFTTLTGYSREETIGKTPRVLKSGKTPPDVYKELWKTITSGNEWSGELCNKKKNGELYWEYASISPVKNPEGVITNFIAVKEDITERKNAEMSLQQSQKRLAEAQKLAHLGNWNWDIVKNELSWSEEVYRIFGLKPQEFGATYEAFLNFVHIDDREFVKKSVDNALYENKPYNIDHRIVLPDGSVRIVNEQAEVVFDSTGKAIQMNGTVQDITERKLIEEGLRTRERQQAAISELGMHALEDPDINTLMNEAVSITALALRVEYCKILELLPDGKALLLKAGVGWKTGSVGYATVGADTDSQAGYTLHSDKPVIVGDIRTETRFSAPSLLLEHRVVSGMSIILKGKDRPFGVMGVHTTRLRVFTSDDANFLLSVSNVVADAIERKRLSAHIDHVAQYDTLTDLPNRILFIDRVTRAVSRAKREKERIAVLYLNLDRFKVINDSMGNETGDGLLKSVAERMVNCVREGDTVSRMGGDEFAIMLGGITSAPDVTKVSQKIIEAVSKPFVLDDREIHITASIGISMYPQDDEEMEGLIKKARAAMLQAKEHGRNNDRFYNTEMETSSYEMMMLENDLRKALDRRELLLHYQPQVDINTGRIIGVEALVRWRHPDRGMISPAEFIPLAEETGLIVPIGKWVLHTALAQNKAWQEDGLAPIKMSVNFSSVQFRQKDSVEIVANALRETGLKPGYMGLEITESVIMKGADAVIKKFHELKEMGIHICMDDFGTGYSSLSYLKRFPIDILKIDQSFARNVTTDTNDASIVMATIAMAHGLGITTVAEGVETKEQLEFFRSHKCEVVQGYLFSKPLPTEEITKLLREGGRFEI